MWLQSKGKHEWMQPLSKTNIYWELTYLAVQAKQWEEHFSGKVDDLNPREDGEASEEPHGPTNET